MFRGFSKVSIDNKGRLAVPSRYRKRLFGETGGNLVLTLSPMDRAIWLYPLIEWEKIEPKLAGLSDFDKQGRRAKQMMRGYAADCQLDAQGRILIPHELRSYAQVNRSSVVLGQGNKFEIWDEAIWSEQREQWLKQIGDESGEFSDALTSLSL